MDALRYDSNNSNNLFTLILSSYMQQHLHAALAYWGRQCEGIDQDKITLYHLQSTYSIWT